MNHTVASLEEIGAQLESARIASGTSDKEVADAAGVSLTSLYRWKMGQADPAARSLTLAALRVGKTPNELLLRDYSELNDTVFNDEDKADLSRLIKSLKALKALNEDRVSPVKIFAEAVLSTERTVREHRGLAASEEAGNDRPILLHQSGNVTTLTPIEDVSKASGGEGPDYGDTEQRKNHGTAKNKRHRDDK